MKMKSVTHVITTIELGGAEKQLLILANQQILLGYEVTVVFLKGSPELASEFQQIGVEKLVSLQGMSVPRQILRLKDLLKKVKNVHAHLPRAELLVALSLNSKTRMIVSRHNAEQFSPRAPKFLSTALSQFVVSKSVRVIAISSAVSKFLIESQEVKEEEKIEIIYYGRSGALPGIVNSKTPTKVIGTVARLTEQKDYGTLLRAFSLLLQLESDYRLQIIGVGHLENELKSLSAELGISDSVEWLGKVPNPENFISGWDLFVLTSLYEGFGLVLLESMALGVPIVASENSAIPEVLGSDYLGLAQTSNPEDFLRKILSLTQEENRILAIQQLQKNILRFDPRTMAEKVCQLYA